MMHTIQDLRLNVHHNGDWSGVVIVSWTSKIPSTRPVIPMVTPESGRIQLYIHERRVQARGLISGYWQPVVGDDEDPPMNVITRAIAVSVECYLMNRVRNACEDIVIPREGP